MRFMKKLLIAAGAAAMLSTAASALSSVKPGINILTGTSKPETFDSYTTLPSNITGGVLSESPFSDEKGKVLFYDKQTKYGSFHFSFSDPLPKERAYQVSFKLYQKADEGYGTKKAPVWIMKNGTSGWQVVKEPANGLVANNAGGWVEYSYLINNFHTLTNTKTNELDTSEISKILVQWELDSAESSGVHQKVYMDDVSIVPAYLVTFLDEDGSEYRKEYIHIDGDTYVPTVTNAEKEKGLLGWSAKNDGTADEEITVNNKDFTLYAVYDKTVRIKLSSDVTLIDAKDGTTTIKATVSNVRDNSTTFSWKVAEGGDYVTLTDNGDGTATVCSKSEGMSKITYTASSGETAEIYILSKYIDIPDIEVKTKVVDISKYTFDANHKESYYDENEQAYKFVNKSDIVKSDDGNGNIVYYTDGFLRLTNCSIDTSVYKYLLVTLKQDVSRRYQIRYEYENTWYSVAPQYPTFAATNGEYVTYAFDMGTGCENKTFKSFVIGLIGTGEAYVKDIRFSNVASETPETPETRMIKIIEKPTAISTEAGTATMKAAVFKNKASLAASTPSWSVSDSSKAMVSSVSGNSAVLQAVTDGTVTVTVSDSKDESVCESFDVTISGQREKNAVYEIRVLFWGASVTKHGPNSALAWTGDWGMAASSEDKDYVHRTVARLEEEFYPAKVSYRILANSSGFDRDISTDTDPNKDYTSDYRFLELETAVKEFKPNIVHIECMGNAQPGCRADCLFNAYSQVFDMIYEQNPDTIIYSGACHLSHRAYVEEAHELLEKRFAEEREKNFIYVHYQLVGHAEYFASEWLELDPPQTGVAAHWNDAGMDEVSRISLEKLAPKIRSAFTPKYVYLPDSLTVSGSDKITTSGGQTKLSVSASPSDASADVIWSVDNEKIATISEYGVLTAVNNGTVNVTATSAYNKNVTATFVVTVSGQPNAYTITYDANTTDAVTGLPEKETLVKGTVTLSAKRPLRDCYTFVGWSKSASGTDCITSLKVEENTTVYAVWEKTTSFEFDGSYDEHFAYTYGFDVKGGFHAEIDEGHITAICTGGEKVKFVSPKVDIANRGFVAFSLNSAYTESGATVELTVKAGTNSAVYKFPLADTQTTTYIADTSKLSGNITGVEIYVNAAPADGSMFGISIDYIRFGVCESVDISSVPFAISDGKTVVASTGNSEGAIITADNAASDDISVVLDSGFGIRVTKGAASLKLYVTADENGSDVTLTKLSYNENGGYLNTTAKVYTVTGSTVSENTDVSGILTSYDVSSFRTAAPTGIRVMASVTPDFYTKSCVSEYGYLVTRNDYLEKGVVSDLIYDSARMSEKKILGGVAFNKEDGTHIIFDVDTEKEIFTCVLTHIPMDKKSLETKLVFRSYVKLDDGTFIYGVKTTKSLCETAKSIIANSADMSADVIKAAAEILEICGFNNDIRIDAGELYTQS